MSARQQSFFYPVMSATYRAMLRHADSFDAFENLLEIAASNQNRPRLIQRFSRPKYQAAVLPPFNLSGTRSRKAVVSREMCLGKKSISL